MARIPTITKRERRGRAYFSLQWSPLEPVSRYRINAAVPSLPGIWELYYLENSRVPRLMKMGAAWRGGVRHKLRFETDPEQPANRDIREALESGDCYYRYTVCDTRDDLVDVYSVLASLRGRDRPDIEPSGRYDEVRIHEPDEMTIRRVRAPGEDRQPLESYGRHVPNMFDVVRELRALEAESSDSAADAAQSTDAAGPDVAAPTNPEDAKTNDGDVSGPSLPE